MDVQLASRKAKDHEFERRDPHYEMKSKAVSTFGFSR